MNEKNQFHISLFKPTTEQARKNRNIILVLVSIWAIGVFGFHFLLRAIEKPTPEPVLIAFNEVWENVKAEDANKTEMQIFVRSALQVTGKVFIKPEHRVALDNGITWATFQLADSAQKIALTDALQAFEKSASQVEVLSDNDYISKRNTLAALAMVPLELKSSDLLSKFIALELRSKLTNEFTAENKAIVEQAMPLYTIHNQSVLTDTKFLGFPFHYFYSAVFLLILFIGICWFYSYKTDKMNKRLQISE
jgi:putative solute:sodium symporter small subunit